MTKLVNNGETLTLNNGSMSNNEPLSKKPICSKSVEEQTEFRNKNHEKYLQYKSNSAKTHDKDESIKSPICISEIDKNDNVTSDNNEDGPWPKGTICIAGDSILSGLQPGLLFRKRKVKVKTFSGANVRDMHDNIKPILWHKPNTSFYTLALTMLAIQQILFTINIRKPKKQTQILIYILDLNNHLPIILAL